MGKNKNQESPALQNKGRPENTIGNLVNPVVVKTVNILDTSKAIVLPAGQGPKQKVQTYRPQQYVQYVPPPQQQIVMSHSQNLLRYHLLGNTGFKTVFGFKTDTSIQPIHIVKDSKIHSLVLSSSTGTIPICVIRIQSNAGDETKIVTISIREEIRESKVLIPEESNNLIEWSENPVFPKGSSISIRIEEENDLDLELFL
jgi:hypothetical protein